MEEVIHFTRTAASSGGAFLESGGKVCIVAERADEGSVYCYTTDRSSHSWDKYAGGRSDSYMQLLPDNGAFYSDTSTLNSVSPEMVYKAKFASTGTYNV